jgi:hypothetical protein
MQQTRNNGHRRPVKDRDWRPTREPAGFWPLPADRPLTVCSRCSAVIPASERAQLGHRAFHEQVAGLEDGRAR